MASPTLLLYDPVPSPWAPKVRQLCAIQGLRYKSVEPTDLDRPLGALAQGLPPAGEPAPGEPLPESVLFLCHLTGPQLDRLLQGLRKAGVPRSCLKAVLTPTNADWTLRALYGELVQERTQLS